MRRLQSRQGTPQCRRQDFDKWGVIMQKVWLTPSGKRSTLYADMLDQVHLLIAGASGSGKSTVVNGLIHTALFDSPSKRQFVFIDPKGTELDEYKRLPHCLCYAQTMPDCIRALQDVMTITHRRFDTMKRQGKREYDGSHIYVIIDELMYFMNQAAIKKQAMAILQDILVIARAARVHVIACTQNCTTATIPATLRCNFDSRLALRTSTAQDSRNILGIKGCEKFPNPTLAHKASAIYMHGGEFEYCESLTRIEETEIHRLVNYWKEHKKPKIQWFRH